jgi:sodium/hydrogen antiporter
MTVDVWLAVVGALGLLVAATSRRLDRLPVSEPLLALLLGIVLGPAVLGVLEVPAELERDLLSGVARATVAVSLMAVALRYPVAELRAHVGAVAWLLVVVLPVMALLTASAAWFLGAGIGLALVLGAALAPIDPVLSSSVVSGEPAERTIPARLRQILSTESGANDGLALPLVLLAATWATGGAMGAASLAAVWSVAGAVLVGWPLGWLSAWALARAEEHRDIDTSHEMTFTLVLALGALGGASLVRAEGLLAVFVTGLAFNLHATSRERDMEEKIDEGVNRVLILPLFLLVGVALPWSDWGALGWRGGVFAAAVLGLRRLPAVLLLRRPLRLDLPGALWLGWFGPIGAAAVYYLTHLEAMGVPSETVWPAGSLVVALSTVLHGVSASPGRAWYGRAERRRGARVARGGRTRPGRR